MLSILENWFLMWAFSYDFELDGQGRFSLISIRYLFIIRTIAAFSIFIKWNSFWGVEVFALLSLLLTRVILLGMDHSSKTTHITILLIGVPMSKVIFSCFIDSFHLGGW